MSNDTIQKCHQRSDTKRVLTYVNRIRADFGLKPLKYLARGSMGSSDKCSIAASLTTKYHSAEVGSDEIIMRRYSRVGNERGAIVQEKKYTNLPKYMSQWIERFDEGVYPGLVGK